MGLLHREQMYVIGLVFGGVLLFCKVGVGAGCVFVGYFRWVVVCARVQFEMLRWFWGCMNVVFWVLR